MDGMLVHCRVTPCIKFAGTHLYTWVERGTVRVKCLAQEHNIMSRARARTRTAQFGDERTNGEVTHWASESEKWAAQKENLHVPNDWTTLFSSPEL